jgi:hypothetical protein
MNRTHLLLGVVALGVLVGCGGDDPPTLSDLQCREALRGMIHDPTPWDEAQVRRYC